MILEKLKLKSNQKEYLIAIMILLLNLLFLWVIRLFEEYIYKVINVPEYLASHVFLEFLGIWIFFMTYAITYYTFNKNKRLRLLVYSSTFFISGFVNLFHTMSYKGMPNFFTESSVQKATIFWIISRLILSFGFFIAGIIPIDKKTNLKRGYFQVGSILITILIFYIGAFKTDFFPSMYIDGHGLTKLKIFLEYFIVFILGITIVFHIKDTIKYKDKSIRTFYIGLCYAVFADFTFTLYRDVYDTYNHLGHIFNIVSAYFILKSIFSYNLDHPYNELSKAKKRISKYADTLEKIVEHRTSELQSNNRKMMKDLEYARRIQQALLPPKFINIYNTKFISEYIPCEKLSGDFYNIYALDEDNLAMYIADVSGHGVSAAVMTVFADKIMKPADLFISSDKVVSPSEKLMSFYKEFNRANFPDEMHIVIFEAVYNIWSGTMSYCSGGMNVLPILVRKNGDMEFLDKSTGFPICNFEDFYSPKYENGYVKLNSGDRVIFYTDGLLDHLKDNLLLKKEAIINIMKENKNNDIKFLNEKILSEIIKTTELNSVIEDDITYFIFEA